MSAAEANDGSADARKPPATISEARPHSAWVLVVVASATLWISGQIAPWVIAVQLIVLGTTWWRRLDPFPFQSSGGLLNLVMMFITGTTIAVALEGRPSTVALAHFCALTQVLQLLDVRPRKSEFLLVALALFQVLLAANLTDSVWFPPLLILFIAATTWTLLVHTLRVEALRAEVPLRADSAVTPSLRRLTFAASAASLALAMIFFVMMPRMKTHVLRGGIGSTRAVAGFNDQVELGTLGRIRQDRTVVLRVETVEGTAPAAVDAYWRGMAFDTFDGKRWSVSAPENTPPRTRLEGSYRFGKHIVPVPIGAAKPRSRAKPGRLVQTITREPVSAGVLFAAGEVQKLDGPKARVEVDANGAFYAPSATEDRVRYTVATDASVPGDAELSGLSARPPLVLSATGAPTEVRDERFLSLPPLEPEVRALAEEMISGAANDLSIARAIETALRRRGRYSDVPPEIDPASSRTAVEQFLLGELAGHCEYFASGMVVLARSVGLPARLVNGFAGGNPNRVGGFVEVTRSEAHAWVEVHFEGAGWVRFDPTPPSLRMHAGSDGLLAQLGALGSAFELWWFQRVVEFDSSDQVAALRSAFHAWKKVRGDGPSERSAPKETGPSLRDLLPGSRPMMLVLLLGLGAAIVLGWRAARDAKHALPPAYARALRHLKRLGIERAPAMSARDLCAAARAVLPPEAARAFDRLTEAYLAERFGGREIRHEFWQLGLSEFELALKQGQAGH